MAGDTIKIDPTMVQALAAGPTRGAGTTDNVTNTLLNSLNTLLGVISPLAGEAMIGPGATALMESLDNAGTGLTNALACFATGMRIMGPAMANAAKMFSSTDSSLASTFQELERLLPQVESYATTVKLQAPAQAEIAALSQYIAQAQTGKVPISLNVATMAVSVPPPSPKGWLESAWDNTGGAVAHFVSQHSEAILIGAGIGAITAAGILLTPVTGGGSDVAAAAADSALIGAAGAEAAVGTATVSTVAAGSAPELVTAADLADLETVITPADIPGPVPTGLPAGSLTTADLPSDMQLAPLVPAG